MVTPERYWVRTLRAQTIKFVERGLERLGLDHRTTVGRSLYGNLHGDEPGMSSKAFFRCNLNGSGLLILSKELGDLIILLLWDLFGPGPLPWFSSPFILAFTLFLVSTCKLHFLGLRLVPSAHTYSGWG